MATVSIYCPTCQATVTAFTLVRHDDLKNALAADAPIKVMHFTDNGGEHARAQQPTEARATDR